MKKKTSRIFAIFLCLILSVCLGLTACGGDDNDVSRTGKTTIRFYAFGGVEEKKALKELVNTFNNQSSTIYVQANIAGSNDDHKSSINTTITDDTNPPDVFYAGDGEFGTWLAKGIIQNLQEYVDKSQTVNLSDMYTSAVKEFRWDKSFYIGADSGDIYGIPSTVQPHLTFYNATLFNASGITIDRDLEKVVEYDSNNRIVKINDTVPLTWDEMHKLAEQLVVKDNKNNITRYGLYTNNWFNYGWSNGANIVSDDRRTFTIDDQKLLEALNEFVSLSAGSNPVSMRPNVVGTNSCDMMFYTQKVAMITSGSYLLGPCRVNADFNWDVMPLCISPNAVAEYKSLNPGATEIEARKANISGHSGSVAYCMSSKSKNKDYAWEFIEYMTSKTSQLKMAQAGLGTPVYKSIAQEDIQNNEGQKPSNYKLFSEVANYYQSGDWTYYPDRQWVEEWSIQFNTKVLGGEMSLAELINTVKTPTQDLLDGYIVKDWSKNGK